VALEFAVGVLLAEDAETVDAGMAQTKLSPNNANELKITQLEKYTAISTATTN